MWSGRSGWSGWSGWSWWRGWPKVIKNGVWPNFHLKYRVGKISWPEIESEKNAYINCDRIVTERKTQRRETSHFVNRENEKDLFNVSVTALPMAKLNSEKVVQGNFEIFDYIGEKSSSFRIEQITCSSIFWLLLRTSFYKTNNIFCAPLKRNVSF